MPKWPVIHGAERRHLMQFTSSTPAHEVERLDSDGRSEIEDFVLKSRDGTDVL